MTLALLILRALAVLLVVCGLAFALLGVAEDQRDAAASSRDRAEAEASRRLRGEDHPTFFCWPAPGRMPFAERLEAERRSQWRRAAALLEAWLPALEADGVFGPATRPKQAALEALLRWMGPWEAEWQVGARASGLAGPAQGPWPNARGDQEEALTRALPALQGARWRGVALARLGASGGEALAAAQRRVRRSGRDSAAAEEPVASLWAGLVAFHGERIADAASGDSAGPSRADAAASPEISLERSIALWCTALDAELQAESSVVRKQRRSERRKLESRLRTLGPAIVLALEEPARERGPEAFARLAALARVAGAVSVRPLRRTTLARPQNERAQRDVLAVALRLREALRRSRARLEEQPSGLAAVWRGWREAGFTRWLGHGLHGDFGRRITVPHEPVSFAIADRIAVSLRIGGLALMLALGFGLPLGMWLSSARDSLLSRGVHALGGVLLALPGFVVVLVLAESAWSHAKGLAPPLGGASDPQGDAALPWMRLLIPSVTLALPIGWVMARHVARSAVGVADADFVRLARARGMPPLRVALVHVLPHALTPLVAWLPALVPGLLLGNAIVESVFGIDGLGRLALEAAGERDARLLLALVLLGSAATAALMIVSDLLARRIDPRTRLGRGGLSAP